MKTHTHFHTCTNTNYSTQKNEAWTLMLITILFIIPLYTHMHTHTQSLTGTIKQNLYHRIILNHKMEGTNTYNHLKKKTSTKSFVTTTTTQNITSVARETALQLRTLLLLQMTCILFLELTWWLRTICNFTFKRSDTLFQVPQKMFIPGTQMYILAKHSQTKKIHL